MLGFGIDRKVHDLREFRGLDEELLLWNEAGNALDFRLVQVELPAVWTWGTRHLVRLKK